MDSGRGSQATLSNGRGGVLPSPCENLTIPRRVGPGRNIRAASLASGLSEALAGLFSAGLGSVTSR